MDPLQEAMVNGLRAGVKEGVLEYLGKHPDAFKVVEQDSQGGPDLGEVAERLRKKLVAAVELLESSGVIQACTKHVACTDVRCEDRPRRRPDDFGTGVERKRLLFALHKLANLRVAVAHELPFMDVGPSLRLKGALGFAAGLGEADALSVAKLERKDLPEE